MMAGLSIQLLAVEDDEAVESTCAVLAIGYQALKVMLNIESVPAITMIFQVVFENPPRDSLVPFLYNAL